MKLYPHQKEALEKTKGKYRVAYYYDMGLGKTYIGSEKMIEIGNKVNLLICQKSKVMDWFHHFDSNYPKIKVIDYTKKRNQISAKDIIRYSAHCMVVIIVNYELAWRRPELAKLSEITLILDESSLIQNSKAKQTKFILRNIQDNACILLSGTPCGGKFENLWTQYHLLGSEMTKKEFEDKFINFELIKGVGGFPIRIVDRRNPYKNIEELKLTLRKAGALFKKTEEVMTLPEQTFVNVFSPMTKEYKRFLKDRVVKVDDKEMLGNSVLSYRLGLRQLASGYSKEKLNAFSDLLQSTSDRLIVFYSFNHELDSLTKICEEFHRPVSMVNGRIKDLNAYENETDSVTLVQYQAGSMGLNLQKANKIIYFSLPESLELFEQSKKRIHRIGQKNACTYYVMLTASSIDQAIYRALGRKQDYTDELFREEFIKEE